MSLTLVTNPAPNTSQIFAGLDKIEYIFKREDLSITGVSSGVGAKALITVATDLTSVLSVGDTIYLYSEGTNYTYDVSSEIITITSTEITIDFDFIETSTGGYINYLKNYYVEMQLVNPTLSAVNLLPFSLESDGDAAGNITIDVSIINDLNNFRGSISQGRLTDEVQEFEVKYREVYEGSSNSFTLLDNKLLVVINATETPNTDEIINEFDLPKIYLGYPAAVTVANLPASSGSTIEVTYNELNINQVSVGTGTLGSISSENGGISLWEWSASTTVENSTRFIEFNVVTDDEFDFRDPDFADPDFVTQ